MSKIDSTNVHAQKTTFCSQYIGLMTMGLFCSGNIMNILLITDIVAINVYVFVSNEVLLDNWCRSTFYGMSLTEVLETDK